MLKLIGDLLHGVTGAVADWRHRQQAYAELAALDDRSLADIGITRSEIPFVLSHASDHGAAPTKTAANANLQHAA